MTAPTALPLAHPAAPQGEEDAEMLRRFRAALQDIAEAEAIPNDAVAFVWCRSVALAALAPAEIAPGREGAE